MYHSLFNQLFTNGDLDYLSCFAIKNNATIINLRYIIFYRFTVISWVFNVCRCNINDIKNENDWEWRNGTISLQNSYIFHQLV